MRKFKVCSPYEPAGDQPQAIQKLAEGFLRGDKFQTLKGVTGSGKTFTMAKIIEAVQRPTLIISHNKTLSAQLYREFKTFFPDNAVEYFVSYYDYYQPEAYVPARDLYIEKDADVRTAQGLLKRLPRARRRKWNRCPAIPGWNSVPPCSTFCGSPVKDP